MSARTSRSSSATSTRRALMFIRAHYLTWGPVPQGPLVPYPVHLHEPSLHGRPPLIRSPYRSQTGCLRALFTLEAVQSPADPSDLVDPLSGPSELLDRRERWSGRHRRAVARYSLAIGAAARLPLRQQELLRRAALLHDVGKLALPERILAGESPLSDHEWELIRTHPGRGAEIVSGLGGGAELAGIIAAHHERLDGHGYPDGLTGAEIPLLARIIAVAEAYDAMTAEDSYQQPVLPLQALRRLSQASGTQFEPRFVEILVGALAGGGLR
jgi:putative nucleotidyltransferase with HDIG domain